MDPCIPDNWPGFSVEYRPLDGGSNYSIEVRSPAGAAEIIHELRMDGELLPHSAKNGQIRHPNHNHQPQAGEDRTVHLENDLEVKADKK